MAAARRPTPRPLDADARIDAGPRTDAGSLPDAGRRLDTDAFAARLDAHLARVTRRRGALGAPQVAVTSERLGLDYRFGDQERRFHVASIGKTFTATLVMQLVEAGAFAVDTSLSALLPHDELARLFERDGTADAAGGATVHHLLTHTSGVADYFDGPVTRGSRMRRLVLDDPDRLWTPAELLAFSRERQRPVGRPGARFAYSDTGYVLLGRVLEQATGRAFHDLLHERVFAPLGLRDSALLFRPPSAPDAAAMDLAPFRLGRIEASRFTSMSCDWAGGGIVATPGDLRAFSRALHRGELIGDASLAYLSTMPNRFRPGIRYGAGMMQVRFEGFSPLLRGLPRPVGHIGVLATHLFHDPVHDAEIVLNFASTREMVRSFRTLIVIEQALQRLT
ncbi:D-alanyl-D-alanine carboxypeptidase [Agromyces sp. CF514]|uniref:serine hydrolase domain-containing protein n=1 Tax=Agromyces sp. CF514 TaxID=1881031 RepID=UPI0008E6AD42|nr:serine hydrolase domain-containing protein [Agromyces sp. CF514]SFR69845.1 D-alanyl-D-alanine carboxypeptidase [Agromyces sp. CF514]